MSGAPRKRFGQHFLHDPRVIERIVAHIDPRAADAMLEIGPGQGALTAPLAARVDRLHVVEIDRDLVARLKSAPYADRLVIHAGDVLEFDLAQLPEALRVVGNLPYNISTPIMFRLLASAARLRDLHFMLQAEVVDRIVAAPGSASYGRLSVMVQARMEATRLMHIGPGAFRPAPAVDSAIVRLVPKTVLVHGVADERFAKVVTAAFTKRRKTLRNALADWVSAEQLSALGIDPGLRPENLAVADYAAIVSALPG